MLVFRASKSVSQRAWRSRVNRALRRVSSVQRPRETRRWRITLHAFQLVMLSLASCSVYDSELLQSINPLAGGPRAGAEGTRGSPVITSTGIASDASVGLGPDETPQRRPSAGANDADDAGAGAVVKCGDGQVNGVEKCDTSIPMGEPGACPAACPNIERCVPRVLNGTGCQTECVLRGLTCESGDGCCPGNCTRDNDLDCSSRCGDGIVQTTSGETCEAETDKPCMTSAAACDDEDACTNDSLTGSPSNCNVACLYERIETVGPDDGCCPSGGNARTDPNCEPRCGNGVKEDGEDCDGSDDCDPGCKFINAEERTQCSDQASNDCERCACEKCTATELACRGTDNQNNNRLCGDIIACSSQNNCIGTPCYCGVTLACTPPAGPCRDQIESAGGTALQVAAQVGDPATLVGKSYAADQCRVAQCGDVCR
jgi:hypothetical protein